ncbi:MAG: amidohydrolase family protein [Oscillospiraceae bacterium]|nr:amidohydrolase family protein [Oscillospiraceae bacterium]
MKKIDIHCHVTAFPQYAPPRHNGTNTLSAEQQILIHDKLNVDIGVLLPDCSPEGIYLQTTNEETKFITAQHPERFMWFCNVDPRMVTNDKKADLGHLLNHYKSLGAKGLGELTATIYADDPRMDNLFYHCEQNDMPVLIHISPVETGTYGIIDELGLPRIEKMLKKYPDLKLIGHSAAFWSEISQGLTQDERNNYPKGKVEEGKLPILMREYGNLYCDLSAGSGANAMMRDPEYAARFIEEFADRIYYGTDVCAANATFQYDFDVFLTKMVDDGMISSTNYEKIIRKNAEKLLRIEVN